MGCTTPPLAFRDVANAQRIEQLYVKIHPILNLSALRLGVFIEWISKQTSVLNGDHHLPASGRERPEWTLNQSRPISP
jgi:hypothetical protein